MTAALEEIKIIDVEEWGSLATSPSPTKLKNGQSPDMKNVWVDEKPGSVITAPGLIRVGKMPSGTAVTLCFNYFKTSDGSQTFIVSDNQTVWKTVDFQNFTVVKLALSASFQLRAAVIRDKLWMTNGTDPVMTYDGTTLTVLDGGGGTPNVPKGRYIAYHDERVWLYHISGARSKSAFSALTDTSGTVIDPDNANAWPSSNTLQISEGDADFGTGLLLYRGYLHFFKQYSIWRLVGYDEYTYTRVKTRASTGTRFNESLQVLDSLVHMIGVDGIYVFDGEETERISDIIDPSTASQTAFGFNQLQQPNANNLFWEVTDTADWNTGAVSANLAVDDSLALIAADDSQADFQAGATQINLDLVTNPGAIQLSHGSSGHSGVNIALNRQSYLAPFGSGSIIGVAEYITDGALTNSFGASGSSSLCVITLDQSSSINRVIVRGFSTGSGGSEILIRGQNSTPITSFPPSTFNPFTSFPIALADSAGSDGDRTFDLSNTPVTQIVVIMFSNSTATEIEIYQPSFQTTGKFTSKLLDLGEAPVSFGNFAASETLNGQGTTYFTQSSADGISWDSEVSCTNGGAIGSTVRRYLRWGVNLTSDGSNTPVISAAYLPAVYISIVHNTGGSIFAWGPIESERTLPLQTIYYYKTGTSPAVVAAAAWNVIVPGGVVNSAITDTYVQFKIEIINGDSTHLPVITSVTFNWIVGSAAIQINTLQNVASAVWKNRYWLAAAGPGATANNVVLVRGKKSFGSPWQLKDFKLLSFTRFQDKLYAGTSITGPSDPSEGAIFQIDTGYSFDGVAIDSYFQTGDYIFGGFYINPKEIIIEVERKGPYNLQVGVSIDRGNTWTDYPVSLAVSSFAPSYIKRINIDSFTTDRIRFRLRTDGIDTPFEVHRMIFYYTLEAARGSIK